MSSNNLVSEAQTVFVELSVIPLVGKEQTSDPIGEVLNGIDQSKFLFNERTYNGACIEGEWKQISALIDVCYQRIQRRLPSSYLRITIR